MKRRTGIFMIHDLVMCLFLLSVVISILSVIRNQIMILDAQVLKLIRSRNDIIKKIYCKKLFGDNSESFVLKRVYSLEDGIEVEVYSFTGDEAEFMYIGSERVSLNNDR